MFTAAKLNDLWLSDITFITTREGWLYLCAVIDVFSRRIIGWSMSSRIDSSLVTESLKMALKSRKIPVGLRFHSDRGSQYGSKATRRLLRVNGIIQSMSGRGNAYDNAMMESFFASLKKELIHRYDFATREEVRVAIFEYVEVYYNKQRAHSALGFVSPVVYEGSN